MKPLGYDQQETLTQGYYPRVDSLAINAAPRRKGVAPAKYTLQQTNGSKTDFVAGVSGTTMGGRDGLFSLKVTYCRSSDVKGAGLAPTVPPAGFLASRGCPSGVLGSLFQHYCSSNISPSL